MNLLQRLAILALAGTVFFLAGLAQYYNTKEPVSPINPPNLHQALGGK
jgi:hypothetical protein